MTNPVQPPPDVLAFIRANLRYVDADCPIIYRPPIPGHPAQTRNSGRYVIRIMGRDVLRKHIVWFINRGVWPTREIGHLDYNSGNDRIGNLAEYPLPFRLRIGGSSAASVQS